jgi:hypothetical protein
MKANGNNIITNAKATTVRDGDQRAAESAPASHVSLTFEELEPFIAPTFRKGYNL